MTQRTVPLATALLLLALAGASSAHAQTPGARGQLSGDLPGNGGYGLAVWSGGTVDELGAAATGRGCALVAVWVVDQGGFVGNVLRAPAVVNQAWTSRFPGGPPNGAVIVVCAGAQAPAPPPAASTGARSIGGCPLFPDDNPWATDVSRYPLDPKSDAYIDYILGSGGNKNLHADFGSNPDYGIPYVIVPETQPGVPVSFDYADES